MIGNVSRFAKRLVVLVPGIIIAYLSFRNLLPYIHRRLPIGFAIFVTYVLVAYIFIPALFRGYRILRPAKHVPFYCVTPDGFASDPINVGIIGTRRQLITAMEAAGWSVADPHTSKNMSRQVLSFIFRREYRNAPVSNLYLFGRKQDIAFEIPVAGAGVSRHHTRFWATTFEEKKRLAVHTIHWHHRKSHVYGDNLLWVGAASLDVGLAPIRHNFQLTHLIHPDTNQERELIVAQLRKQHLVDRQTVITLDKPYRLMNRALTAYANADGMMRVVWLKKSKP
jgi:hypothetical protein